MYLRISLRGLIGASPCDRRGLKRGISYHSKFPVNPGKAQCHPKGQTGTVVLSGVGKRGAIG